MADRRRINMRRLVSMLLAVMLLSACFIDAAALAAGEAPVRFTLTGAENVRPGEEAAVSLCVEGEERSAHTLVLHVYFNADMLCVGSVVRGEAWDSLPEDAMVTCDSTSHPGEVAFAVISPSQPFTLNGVLFEVVFTVAEACTKDQRVSLVVSEMYYSPGFGDAEAVPFEAEDGVITLCHESAPYSGSCGSGVFWQFDREMGTLTVSGEGRMDNYTPFRLPPWEELKPEIKTVVIEPGVVNVGNYAFANCPLLAAVYLPDGVTTIGHLSFMGCPSLVRAEFAGVAPVRCFLSSFSGTGDGFALYYYSAYRFLWKTGKYDTFHGYPAVMICTVTFEDWDGTVISTQYVDSGCAAVEPEDYEFSLWGYTYAGWDGDTSCITDDTVFTAVYEINKYTVTFTGEYEGETIVEHGGSAELPVLDSPSHHYVFFLNGEPWNGQNVTSDLTVEVGVEVNVYTVTFVDMYGFTIGEEAVEYGGAAHAPEAPEYEGYTFIGWDAELSFITGDITATALYERIMCTVTFVGFSGEVIEEVVVEYGSSVPAPDAPEVEGYVFIGWDKQLHNVTADMTVNAVYEIIRLTVTFIGFDGEELSVQIVDYGSAAEAPEVPEIEGYDFIGWDREFDCVKEELTVTALYEIRTFTVTFVGFEGEVIAEVVVEYGSAAEAPEVPEIEGFVFIGWSEEFGYITSDLTVTACYMALGDVDGDGAIGFNDVTLLCSFLLNQAELDDAALVCADVNGDGMVDFRDVSAMLGIIVSA